MNTRFVNILKVLCKKSKVLTVSPFNQCLPMASAE